MFKLSLVARILPTFYPNPYIFQMSQQSMPSHDLTDEWLSNIHVSGCLVYSVNQMPRIKYVAQHDLPPEYHFRTALDMFNQRDELVHLKFTEVPRGDDFRFLAACETGLSRLRILAVAARTNVTTEDMSFQQLCQDFPPSS